MVGYVMFSPNYDEATYVLSSFIEAFHKKAKEKLSSVLVGGIFANRAGLEMAISESGNNVLLIGAHGDYDRFYGKDDVVVWKVGDDIKKYVANKDIIAISCRTGKDLSRYCIRLGAKLYKGYEEIYVFAWDRSKPPTEDVYARAFMETALKRGTYLFDGITPDEAEAKSEKMAQGWIKYFEERDPEIAWILRYDESIKVYLKQGQSFKSWWERLIEKILEWIREWLF